MCSVIQQEINSHHSQDIILNLKGLPHVCKKILCYFDARTLCSAEVVCKDWKDLIYDLDIWRLLIQYNTRVHDLWRKLGEKRKWADILRNSEHDGEYYRALYPQIVEEIQALEYNWRVGTPRSHVVECGAGNLSAYCLQFDDEKIVAGLNDNNIKIWNRNSKEFVQTISGHVGSVLCLQYQGNILITGSSDSTVRVWDITTGDELHRSNEHHDSVIYLKFNGEIMVTGSKDKTSIVWDISNPVDLKRKHFLCGHLAPINVLDFDESYIVTGSGDKKIRVWNTSTGDFVRTLEGHERSVTSLMYHDKLTVSGSNDKTIRIWRTDTGSCLNVLRGHEALVRSLSFDDNYIVSGDYDGEIKVWDMKRALAGKDARLCQLEPINGRVYRLLFNEFQIIACSSTGTIAIWDFLNDVDEYQNIAVTTTPIPTVVRPLHEDI